MVVIFGRHDHGGGSSTGHFRFELPPPVGADHDRRDDDDDDGIIVELRLSSPLIRGVLKCHH